MLNRLEQCGIFCSAVCYSASIYQSKQALFFCEELFFWIFKRACAARISEADFKDTSGRIKSNRPEVTSACSEYGPRIIHLCQWSLKIASGCLHNKTSDRV